MSVSLAWKPKHFGGLNTNQLQLLYESILLGSALAEARHLPVYIPESQTQGDYSQEMPDFEAFRFYVNKVAQTCDNERGGDSITALAILKGSTGPNYVFGSNAKGSNELKATEDFVKTLLHLVGDNPDELKSSPLARRVLWFILSFNISRIEEYLDYLNRSIEQCREYCKRHNNDKDVEVMKHLELLAKDSDFEVDTTSDNAQDLSLSKCVTLINAIHDLGNRGFNNSVSQKAKDGEITRSEPWCDLRHYLGRWHSYRQAADGIVAAAKRWPFLFQDFEITMVPSSSRIPKPIQKTRLPASEIIEHMAERDNLDADPIQQMVRDLQIPELDEIIREHLNARRFRPIVHAEVLVHAHLRRLDPLSPDKFWNNWNYIGSSKPTCRLCHYYFDSFEGCKVYVRQSHHNLYKKWRLPDFDEAFDTEEKRDQLLERIAQKLRDDVRSSLKEKNIKGKVHDSNTYSSVPDMLQGNWRGVATDERGWQQHARAAAEDNGSTALTERNVSSLNLTDGNGESSD